MEHRWFKIGVTRRLEDRVRAIQTSVPFKIVLLASVKTRQGEIVEQETPLRFKDKQLRGEWFKDLDIAEVAAFMTEQARRF